MLTTVSLCHGEPESRTTKPANLRQMCICTKTTATQRGLFKINLMPNNSQNKRTAKKELVLF